MERILGRTLLNFLGNTSGTSVFVCEEYVSTTTPLGLEQSKESRIYENM